MMDGFEAERWPSGVPALPRPTSEAWLLCILKRDSYLQCDELEDRSGSQKASRPLKEGLEEVVGGQCSREGLCGRLQSASLELGRLTMPSFVAFRTRLEEVLGVRPPSPP
jgi:hypothetical protein